MDGSEAQFISCWTRYCSLAGRFMVVNIALVLSIEQVLGRGFYLNLSDREIKGGVFGEVLDVVD